MLRKHGCLDLSGFAGIDEQQGVSGRLQFLLRASKDV
jgi:hypothetical protein